MTQALAEALGVTPASLKAIGLGWNGQSYTFPERAADGTIIGVTTRSRRGRKLAMKGSRRGLIIPTGFTNLPDPVLIVEGPSDVAAALSMGLSAVGRPSAASGADQLARLLKGREVIVVGENDRKEDGRWPGREGAKAIAERLSADWQAPVQWSLPPDGTKDLRALLQQSQSESGQADNADRRLAGEQVLAAVRANATVVQPPRDQTSRDSPGRRGLAEMIIELVDSLDHELCRTPDGRPFIVFKKGRAVYEIGTSTLTRWLTKQAHAHFGRAPAEEVLKNVSRLLAARSMDGPVRSVHRRVARHGGHIFLDLNNDAGEVVEINPNGWQITTEYPVLFERADRTLPLPRPVRGGRFEEIAACLNLSCWDDYVLVASFMLAVLRGEPPYPLLVLSGDAGSAKSTAMDFLKQLLDPTTTLRRSRPQSEQDVAIAASHEHLLCFDNFQSVPKPLSDLLCVISTGGTHASRRLYSNNEEVVLALGNPVILTGIGDLATRADLLDRAFVVRLPPIRSTGRMDEQALRSTFTERHPRILGALLTAMSAALREEDKVSGPHGTRLADVRRTVVAAEDALGWMPGTFDRAMAYNAHLGDDVAIEWSPIGDALLEFIARDARSNWEGTATELLDVLRRKQSHNPRDWPTGAAQFSHAVRAIAPNLRRRGIEIEFRRIKGKRRVTVNASRFVASLGDAAWR